MVHSGHGGRRPFRWGLGWRWAGLAAVLLGLGGRAAEPAAPTPEFTFALVADPHLAEVRKDGGPSGVERWQHLMEVALSRPRPPDFMVVLGDLIPPVDPQTKQPDLALLIAAAARLPLYVVAGNNDSLRVREALRKTFPEIFRERDFYAFTRHDCRFVMVCDAVAGDHYGHIASESIRGQPQWSWLESQLRPDGEVQRVFVLGHVPPHPTGADANMYLALGDQKLLADLITRYRPEALFFGHCHQRQDFVLGTSPVHVLPSSHWNMQGVAPAFVEVSVFETTFALDYVTLVPPYTAGGKP